jgi:MraZ protein
MFISTYENKLDKKGRVSVPAAYRSHLSNLGYNSVICYPSFTNSSIEFCPQSRLEKIAETIDTLNPFEENRDIFSTSILANSSQLNFDGEGRITLSEKLLEHSGIKEKILFVGQGKTFQMWEPAEFKKFSDQARKKANLKRSELKWKQSNN